MLLHVYVMHCERLNETKDCHVITTKQDVMSTASNLSCSIIAC